MKWAFLWSCVILCSGLLGCPREDSNECGPGPATASCDNQVDQGARWCDDFLAASQDAAALQASLDQRCSMVSGTWSTCPCSHGSIGGCRSDIGNGVTRTRWWHDDGMPIPRQQMCESGGGIWLSPSGQPVVSNDTIEPVDVPTVGDVADIAPIQDPGSTSDNKTHADVLLPAGSESALNRDCAGDGSFLSDYPECIAFWQAVYDCCVKKGLGACAQYAYYPVNNVCTLIQGMAATGKPVDIPPECTKGMHNGSC